jgi:septal ring factor EnvC (AmiA/AmiB activator)
VKAVLGFALFAFSFSSAKADVSAENLVRTYKEIKGDIMHHEEAKRKVLADLFHVTLGMKKINRRRELLMNEKHFVETRIEKASGALRKIKSDPDGQRAQLRARLRGLYKFNGQTVMRLIFSSQTPADLDANLKILKILADKDYFLIRSYEKNLALYSRETRKLEGHQKRLVAIEAELKTHEKELLAQQEEKNRIVEGIDKETLGQLLRLERLRDQSSKVNRAQSDASLTLARSFFESKGRLSPPIRGRVERRFGPLRDKRYGTKLRSKGIFIAAAKGSAVKSVFDGEVLFSDSVPGFGKTVILSHGDRYYTVYGNNSDVLVKRGQRVSMGELLAHAGPSWHHLSSGTYFEIRHFSDFVNPKDWFKEPVEGKL